MPMPTMMHPAQFRHEKHRPFIIPCCAGILFLSILVFTWQPVMSWGTNHGQLQLSGAVVCARQCSLQPPLHMSVNNNDEEDDDEDDDDDDDDDIPTVDTSQFVPPKTMVSFGLNKGRSAPSQRKAMGTSAGSATTVHVCTNCGSEFVKWMGRCPTCKQWNTVQEVAVPRESNTNKNINKQHHHGLGRPIGRSASSSSSWVEGILPSENNGYDFGSRNNDDFGGINDNFDNPQTFVNPPLRITDVVERQSKQRQRVVIPDDPELSNVLGGGIMKGSLILLGGDPGVGKSTLSLQTAASVASQSTSKITDAAPVWYVSGEETAEQIASRAQRLGVHKEPHLWLLSETHVDALVEQVVTLVQAAATNSSLALYRTLPPALIVVDSIQTMVCNAGGASAAGGVTQMRECVALLLRLAKSTGIPIVLVGHVTKSGTVAGPRTVEHMVDCVLYLEGMHKSGGVVNLRMLRASKNRFGNCDEVGVYEMTTEQLMPVSDPSSLLLEHRLETEDIEGSAVTVVVEGIRAMTVEIQALVTPTSMGGASGGSAKRTVVGIAFSRLSLLLAVLQKRMGMFFGRQDVYINVVGEIRLDRNGRGDGSTSDVAVAVALVSSIMSIPVRSDTCLIGEVGLLGEIRPASGIEKRIQEARRMGFSRFITPMDKFRQGSGSRANAQDSIVTHEHGIERIQCRTLLSAINAGLVKELPKRRKRKSTKRVGQNVPGSLKDLHLEETIMDDDFDEDGDAVFL